ncbi:unnamed protein product, partial [Chrysoparadoxa australica]
LPQTQSIGLTAYGHRTKGDCTDIETLVLPGAASRDAIGAAVNKLRPRGKTPMTDAVVAAATALKYTEDPATVILVSDGIETCNPDPCAAARALEEAGAQLTVHVVGFDVSDPEARRQMQCLADETGGQFLLAANATELGQALGQVTQAQPVYPTLFVATDGANGGRIETPLIWDVKQGEELVVDLERNASFSRDLMAGTYTVSVLRPDDEASVEKTFTVVDAGQTVTLELPSSLPDASVSGPASAVAGSTIQVDWTGPDAKGDYLSVAKPDDKGYVNYVYTRDGTPGALVMPPEAGSYELRYIMAQDKTVLATRAITVSDVTATLDVPDTAPAGAAIPIGWTGPDYKGDYLTVSKPDDAGYETYTYTREGTPLDLTMPADPGTYEVRYVMAQGKTVLASTTVEVSSVSATLDVVAEARAGAPVLVTWDGPGYKPDFITVADADMPADKYHA